jgi:hypothetical protein
MFDQFLPFICFTAHMRFITYACKRKNQRGHNQAGFISDFSGVGKTGHDGITQYR